MNTASVTETFAFCPVLAETIQTNALTGRSGRRFEGLGALSSLNNLVTLRRLGMELKPKRTLEVGLSFGGSCLVFAATHRDLGGAACAQHMALDPFQTQVWDDTGLMAVEAAGLSGYVDFRPAFSSLELPKLVEAKAEFDMIYIDGSHLVEDVFVDMFFAARLLSLGGVMLFDDSSDPHVQKVLRFVRGSLGGAFTEMHLGKYRDDGGTTLKYRVAQKLRKVQLTAFRRTGDVVRPWDVKFAGF